MPAQMVALQAVPDKECLQHVRYIAENKEGGPT